MTTVNDDLIRAFLADEARRAVAAGPSLEEAVGRLAPRIGGRPSGASQRLIVFLAATMLLVAALGTAIAVGSGILRLPLVIDSSTVSPFEGTWISTSDADGGTQTMSFRVSTEGAVDITVHDTIASVCSGTPSTMTGTGAIEGGTRLVISAPVYACDDGSQPQALSGLPLEEQLRNWTLALDAPTGTLSDGVGGVWYREGAVVPSPDSSSQPMISDTMWPQTTLEEVRQAQELADGGDPAYTWQVDALPEVGDYPGPWERLYDGQVELVDRFLREVLGWEAYMQNLYVGGADHSLTDQRFLRCAPGRTNPLYPPQPDSEQVGESCAPTLDELTYESVSLDLVQPDRQGPGGIWVVSNWRPTTFAQADPAVAEAKATERLEEFLAARIAGTGADGYVQFDSDLVDVPLLYATTSGAPYERYEIERVVGPRWPDGLMTFSARLFADGDATVVEQEITWQPSGGLWLDANATTENGRPVVLPYTSPDGEVTVAAPGPWEMLWPGEAAHELAPDVWFGLLSRDSSHLDSSEHIGLVDPVAYDAWCAANGGFPLLSAPADAAAIAEQVIADPNFETTAPVAARIGGLEAVSIDVALAPGGEACKVGMIEISRWIHTIAWDPELRLRLYLVDLPEGMSVETLAITIVAPDERFEEVVKEAETIIESIEFHPG